MFGPLGGSLLGSSFLSLSCGLFRCQLFGPLGGSLLGSSFLSLSCGLFRCQLFGPLGGSLLGSSFLSLSCGLFRCQLFGPLGGSLLSSPFFSLSCGLFRCQLFGPLGGSLLSSPFFSLSCGLFRCQLFGPLGGSLLSSPLFCLSVSSFLFFSCFSTSIRLNCGFVCLIRFGRRGCRVGSTKKTEAPSRSCFLPQKVSGSRLCFYYRIARSLADDGRCSYRVSSFECTGSTNEATDCVVTIQSPFGNCRHTSWCTSSGWRSRLWGCCSVRF